MRQEATLTEWKELYEVATRMKAVSYTHLDVYKRQEVQRADVFPYVRTLWSRSHQLRTDGKLFCRVHSSEVKRTVSESRQIHYWC